MKSLTGVLFIGVFCLSVSAARGQGTGYDVQANIIYRFTKYIDWPEKSGDFIIGVVGETPLFETMSAFMAGKMVGSRKIIVRKFPASARQFSCQILFIPEEESDRVRKIAAMTTGQPLLLVTESEGMCRKGSCINFIIADERLRLEINKGNIEQRKLDVATELLELCNVVK